MLQRLEIENFFSFGHRQSLDLRVAKNVPESSHLAAAWPGSAGRVPRVVALFGANAAGKTNVLKALSVVAWFVRHSFSKEPSSALPWLRFANPSWQHRPTKIKVVASGPAELPDAVIGKEQTASTDPADAAGPWAHCKYIYEASFGGEQPIPDTVLQERLTYFPNGRPIRLFDRNEGRLTLWGKSLDKVFYEVGLERVLRPNASVISTLVQFNHPVAKLVADAAGTVQSNTFADMLEISDDRVMDFYSGSPALQDKLNRQLQRLDLGLKGMTIAKDQQGKSVGLFDHLGLTAPLPMISESRGTRQFVRIFPWLSSALDTGGVALIDELDQAIHPIMMAEIVGWFRDPVSNPHDAQLWFTSQNLSILEQLSKEEVFLCEKGQDGETEVFGLSEIARVRRADNFYRKYLGGVFGAVPRVG